MARFILPITMLIVVVVALCGCQSTTASHTSRSSDLYLEGDWSAALEEASSALSIARSQADEHPLNLALALDNMGTLLLEQGRLNEAESVFREAMNVREGIDELSAEQRAVGQMNLAMLDYRRGRYLSADHRFRGAAAGLPTEAPSLVRATILNNWAENALAQGSYAAAAERLREAEASLPEAEDENARRLAISLKGNKARLARLRWDFAAALQTYEEVLERQRRFAGGDVQTAKTLNNMAEILAETGDADGAARRYVESLSLLKSHLGENHPDVAVVLNNLAIALASDNRLNDARHLATRAVTIQTATYGPEHRAVMQSLSVMAELAYRDGQLSEATRIVKRMLEIAEKSPGSNHSLIIPVLFSLGELMRLSGEAETARAVYSRAQGLIRDGYGAQSIHQVTLDTQLAELALTQRRANEAIDLYVRALKTATSLLGTAHPRLDRIEMGLAEAMDLAGRQRDAIDILGRTIDRRADRLVRQEDRPSDNSGRLFGRYLRLIELDGSQNHFPEAFRAIQLVSPSGTARSITRMAARLAQRDDSLGRLLRRTQDLMARRRFLQDRLLDSVSADAARQDMARGAELRRAIGNVNRDLASEKERLRASYPQFVDLNQTSPLSVGEARSLLAKREALFGTTIVGDDVWIWAISASREAVRRSPMTARELARSVRALRRGLDPTWARERLPNGLAAFFPSGDAYKLYEALIAPLSAVLKNASVIHVIPSGPLYSLPLEVLLTEATAGRRMPAESFATAPWLVRRFAFIYVPAVSALRALRVQAGQARGVDRFLGVGDPLLADHPANRDEPASRAAAGSAAPMVLSARTGVRVNDAFDGARVKVEFIRAMPSLPETASELGRMREFFPGGTLMLRDAATEAALHSRPDMKTFGVIAFATHSLVAGEMAGLSEPGLVMTPPNGPASGDDGLLSASEIATLDLDANWVILSACNTAAPDGTPGAEGLSGLARAFFYAGARSLLVSHWPVVSEPTVELTTTTLAAVRKGGMTAAQAHRHAILRMIASDNGIYRHPSIWAPFVVVGADARRSKPADRSTSF